VDTGIAIANPNSQPASVSFYFTDASGDFGSGQTIVPPNGHIAAFLDQTPFNGNSLSEGTFTFNSSLPVAVTALHGLTNERQEFLMTTLPVADLSHLPAAGSTPMSPYFMDGGGWTTQMELINPTDNALQGSVLFNDPSGATTRTVPYSLAPRGSRKIGTSSTTPTTLAGTVTVQPMGGGVPPLATVVSSFKRDGTTITEAAVPASPDAGTGFRLYAEGSANFDKAGIGSLETKIAVLNRSNSPAVVNVELTNLDGLSTGLTGTLTVPAFSQAAAFLNQVQGLASLSLPFRGIARISSPQPVSVVGLRARYNERGDLLMTTLPTVNETTAPTTNDLFFPEFADGGGYTTQFILFSAAAGQQASGGLRLLSQSGGTLNLMLR